MPLHGTALIGEAESVLPRVRTQAGFRRMPLRKDCPVLFRLLLLILVPIPVLILILLMFLPQVPCISCRRSTLEGAMVSTIWRQS